MTVPGSGFGQEEGTFHLRTTILPPEAKIGEFVRLFQVGRFLSPCLICLLAWGGAVGHCQAWWGLPSERCLCKPLLRLPCCRGWPEPTALHHLALALPTCSALAQDFHRGFMARHS